MGARIFVASFVDKVPDKARDKAWVVGDSPLWDWEGTSNDHNPARGCGSVARVGVLCHSGGMGREAFEATRWSVVLRARDPEEAVARAALSELCRAYWYPLYGFARRRGCAHHEAEDLAQGLFADLIRRESLAGADPARGRFRSFLLGAMKHHMADAHAREAARKRGGGLTFVSLDDGDGEARYAAEAADGASADAYYDRRWALAVLQRAMAALEAEYVGAGKGAHFEALRPHLTGSAPEADVAARLGVEAGHLRVLTHRLRRRFAETLRRQVADTVAAEADVDDELRHLLACLGDAGKIA
jgi:DNA-directed RNA polymerase specialized sigma24 family protein